LINNVQDEIEICIKTDCTNNCLMYFGEDGSFIKNVNNCPTHSKRTDANCYLQACQVRSPHSYTNSCQVYYYIFIANVYHSFD
jgi:hypothetical protein